MEGFEPLIESVGGARQGFPFLVILRPDRSIVVDSIDPERGRNIGSPQAEWEIEYWNVMMKASVTKITEEEIAHMAKTLAEDRKGV